MKRKIYDEAQNILDLGPEKVMELYDAAVPRKLSPVEWFVSELEDHLSAKGIDLKLKETDAYKWALEMENGGIVFPNNP